MKTTLGAASFHVTMNDKKLNRRKITFKLYINER